MNLSYRLCVLEVLSPVTGRFPHQSIARDYRKSMSEIQTLIDAYSTGSVTLHAAMQTVDDHQLDLQPIEGKWSIREVVCHLADSEIVYADRIKRVLAEDNATFFEADPEQFRRSLRVKDRNIEAELNVVELIREHMAPILRSMDRRDFQRMGHHSLDGPMTIMTLLQRITDHIPHHVRFINEKVAAMEH
ncbi:MAG: DinB family protein [Planctomycetota bacterium]